MNQVQKGLILFGHGARDPSWAGPVFRVRDLLRAQHPEWQVTCAFLEYLSPSLDECVAELERTGTGEFTVLPVFIAQGGHLKRELPEMVSRLRERYPQCRFALLPAIGEADVVVSAMADYASSCFSA